MAAITATNAPTRPATAAEKANPGPAKPAAATNPLAPLSAKTIQNQAVKTIGLAYAPAYQDLNQQGKNAQGLADKRSADNRYYQTWLDTQGAALQAHSDAAHAQLQGLQTDLLNRQNALYGGQGAGLAAQADQRAGNVSNNAQSNAFGKDLQANQQFNQGLMVNAAQQADSRMGTQVDQLGAARANDANVIQNARMKQMTDLNTVLQGLSQARSKLNTAKTGDVAKEIARLQGVEIQKAQSNRDYAAAAQKLGISAAETQSLITNRAAATGIAQQNANTAAQRALNTQMNSDRNYQLNVNKYNSATAKDIYQRDHGLGPYKVAKGSAPKPLSNASQGVIYSHIDKTKNLIDSLIHNYGLTPQQAYHVVQHGSTGQIDASPPTTAANGTVTHHYLTVSPNAYGDQILNAAYNVRSNGGTGLSPGDLAALKKLGLSTPGKRYSVGSARGVGAAIGRGATAH